MHFSPRVVAAVLAALPLVTAWPAELTRSVTGFCQSDPSPELLAMHNNIVSGDQVTLDLIAQGEKIIQEALAKFESGVYARDNSGMTITKRDNGASLVTFDAWFHVVYRDQTAEGGYLTDKNIQDQYDALNKAFEPSDIAFRLVNTTYTRNKGWASASSNNKKPTVEMKRKLHQGDAATFNLYLVPGFDTAGYCTFPDEIDPRDPDTLLEDGCVVGSFTLPGNDNVFNMGLTAVHEAGHWLGLLHTFTDGCDDSLPGDYIDDTPYEKTENYGKCPANRDTCPDLPGLDPIDNYMDYSSDACYSRFTPEQTKRMHKLLALYRVSK